MPAYYNEIDPDAVAVLKELVASGVIAPGDVDDRSIKDVKADDLRGYEQCHFFAGGGLWSVAARIAGWADTRPLWTGSCPCQPFSAAGKGLGTDDPRHLWPDFYRLIRACRPPVVMGEQVAGALGYDWFDGVGTDLEGEGYAARAVDIPACAVDAPHQRNRLYWLAVGDSDAARLPSGSVSQIERGNLWHEGAPTFAIDVGADGGGSRLQPDTYSRGRDGRSEGAQRYQEQGASAERADVGLLADAKCERLHGQRSGETAGAPSSVQGIREERERLRVDAGQQDAARRNGSWWSDAEWIVSPLDGKARRAKPGIPFLVDGLHGRVGLWRIGGNAISPILAAEVIKAADEAIAQRS